jgi:hypothetical protein
VDLYLNSPIILHYVVVNPLKAESESESYVTTDGQSASLSWYKAPIRGLRPDFYSVRNTEYVWQLRSSFRGSSSLTRGRVCLLYMLLALASAVFLGSESLGTRDHILLSQIWDFPFRRLLRLAGSRRYSTPPPKVEFLLNNIYKNSVRTSQETHYNTATKPNRLMLYRERVAVYCKNHMKHTNTLRGHNAEF